MCACWAVGCGPWHSNYKSSVDVVTSHTSINQHMSVAMQRLVDSISVVTQQYVTTQQYCNALLAGFSVGRSICDSPLLCNGWRNYVVTRAVFSWSVHTRQSVALQLMTQLCSNQSGYSRSVHTRQSVAMQLMTQLCSNQSGFQLVGPEPIKGIHRPIPVWRRVRIPPP
jgi:hypothetical protein